MDSLSDPDCPSNCPSSRAASIIDYGSNTQYAQIYDKIKSKNKNCQTKILEKLAFTLQASRFHIKCMEEQNSNHPVCQNLLKEMNTVRSRFLELTELVYGKEAVTHIEAQAICVDCTIAANNKNLADLHDLFENLQKQMQCSDLNLEESRVVHSGTGSSDFYTVKRESDGSYSIPLFLKFSPDEDYDGPVSKDKVHEYYTGEVQRCIKQANTQMLGPKGKKLRIVIKNPEETQDKSCDQINTINILIGSQDHRSNAGKYESDIGCPVITHEVLHLLGLCDEYRERSRGYYENPETGDRRPGNFSDPPPDTGYEFKPAYDCRVIASNSIMSNHKDRWDFSFGLNRSLLTPAQFNAILYGNCEKKNKFFNECSKLAYQSTIRDSNCLKKKKQCEEQNALSHSKEEEIRRIKKSIDRVEKDREHVTGLLEDLKQEKSKDAQSSDDHIYYTNKYQNALAEVNRELDSLSKRLHTVQAWPDYNEQ